MKWALSTRFVVSLALLATLVGHVAVQRHFERRSRWNANHSVIESLSAADAPLFSPQMERPDKGKLAMPRFLEELRSGRSVVPAVDNQDDNSRPVGKRNGSPPSAVPTPTDAATADSSLNDESFSHERDSSAVREVIEHELSHASREEREIWFEELRSLPSGVVRDLLQVRKQLHALPKILGGMPEKLASVDPSIIPRTQEITAEPASQKIRFNLPDTNPAATDLEAAISQLRHNLTNSATPGFKRLRVTLVDAYGSGWRESAAADDLPNDSTIGNDFQGQGCRIAPLLLDLTQGTFKKTARQLDLAIDGDGFFVVHRGEKEFLTRCGAFVLNRSRQLCLAVANDNVVLHPLIAIPDDANEIQVSAGGVVTVLQSGESTLAVVGQLQLARVASPARLHPCGNTLYVSSEESGAIVLGDPMKKGFGELQQGVLEQSNVDSEAELAEIEEMSKILKALPPQASRPATARREQLIRNE